jgi:hypothetical protein
MKAIRFEPFGPFPLPRDNSVVNRTQQRSFWDLIEEKHPGLSRAVGCYIFAIRAAKGFTPWYVGKTERQTFKCETWQPGKLLLYGDVIRKYERGRPVMFLLAKLTTNGKFVRPTTAKLGSVAALEEMLIGTCLQRNPELLNKRTTKYLKRLHVPGYINDQRGARTTDARSLASLLKT